ncbi:hypothetical protein TB1_039539 [Malus domestica]
MYSSVPLIEQFRNTKPVVIAGSVLPWAVTTLSSPFLGWSCRGRTRMVQSWKMEAEFPKMKSTLPWMVHDL